MPCHVRSTSVSSRRRQPPLPARPPAAPLALLDLSRPGERAAHDHIHRATTGRRPSWRLLGMRRHGEQLLCVVVWARRLSSPEPYGVVELDLTDATGLSAHYRAFPTKEAACAELVQRGCSPAPEGVSP